MSDEQKAEGQYATDVATIRDALARIMDDTPEDGVSLAQETRALRALDRLVARLAAAEKALREIASVPYTRRIDSDEMSWIAHAALHPDGAARFHHYVCGATWTLPNAPEKAVCPNCGVRVPALHPDGTSGSSGISDPYGAA